jgi:hypothetical protein
MVPAPMATHPHQVLLSAARPMSAAPALDVLQKRTASFAAFFASEAVQLRLPGAHGRYDFLRYVTPDAMPTWLTEYISPDAFDIETRFMHTDAEVQAEITAGSHNRPRAQRLALACVRAPNGTVTQWGEDDAQALVAHLVSRPVLAAFNGHGFDSQVLSRYATQSQCRALYLRILDVMDVMQFLRGEHKCRGLNAHALETLGVGKLDCARLAGDSDELSVPARFRRGTPEDLRVVRTYCEGDCALTAGLAAWARLTLPVLRTFYSWWLDEQVRRLNRFVLTLPIPT